MKRETEHMLSGLRAWREAAGLSLDELGSLAGMTGMAMSLIERGQRNLSPMKKIELSRRLGVSPRELFPAPSLSVSGGRKRNKKKGTVLAA